MAICCGYCNAVTAQKVPYRLQSAARLLCLYLRCLCFNDCPVWLAPCQAPPVKKHLRSSLCLSTCNNLKLLGCLFHIDVHWLRSSVALSSRARMLLASSLCAVSCSTQGRRFAGSMVSSLTVQWVPLIGTFSRVPRESTNEPMRQAHTQGAALCVFANAFDASRKKAVRPSAAHLVCSPAIRTRMCDVAWRGRRHVEIGLYELHIAGSAQRSRPPSARDCFPRGTVLCRLFTIC